MKIFISVLLFLLLVSPVFALFCPRCGVSNDNINNFCRNCGFPLLQVRDMVDQFKSSHDPAIPDAEQKKEKEEIPVLMKDAFPAELKNNDPILDKINVKFKNRTSPEEVQVIKDQLPVNTVPEKKEEKSLEERNYDLQKSQKNELINEIDSIFNRKEGPAEHVPEARQTSRKDTPAEVTKQKADISETPANHSGGIIEIVLRYTGGEKDSFSNYGKVYFNDKYVGNIYRYSEVKKNPYSHLLSKKANYSMSTALNNEVTYQFKKDSIPLGTYSVKVVLRQKLLFGSKDFPKTWKAVQVEEGVVSKLLYEWGGIKDFGE